MTTARHYSLAFLTIPDVGPLEAIRVAAVAGYQMVGLRMLPATTEEKPYPLLSCNKLLHDVATALNDHGIQIGDLEIIRLSPDLNTRAFIPFFERAQFLRAQHLTVVNDDPVATRATESFGRLCETAAPFGLTINLEPMPWTQVRNVIEAARIVESSNQNNAGILIDAFHFYRGGSRLEQLQSISPKRFKVFQICDGPAAFDPAPTVIRDMARTARCIPGQGELDLTSLIAALPTTAIVSVEVPNQHLIRRCSPLKRATQALAAAQQTCSLQPVSLPT